MPQRRTPWRTLVAIGLMLSAILAYVTTLDDSDPDPMAEVSAPVEPGSP
jgi:hypothetical protein